MQLHVSKTSDTKSLKKSRKRGLISYEFGLLKCVFRKKEEYENFVIFKIVIICDFNAVSLCMVNTEQM